MSNSCYPMLKRFLVELFEMGDKRRPQPPGYDAPNLTSVFLCGLGLSYCPPPLNAVTELHLAAENNLIDVGELYEILQACAKPLITLCTLVRAWPLGTTNEVSELLLWISALDLEELTIASFIHRDLAALPPENPNNPKFPALKSLTSRLLMLKLWD